MERGQKRGRFRGRRGQSRVQAADRESQIVNNENVGQPKRNSFSEEMGRGQNRGRFRGQRRQSRVQAADRESQNVNNENLGQPESNNFRGRGRGNHGYYHRHYRV